MKAREFLDNYQQVMYEMHEYHELFMQLAVTGKPQITDLIDTAAVAFNKEGRCIDFLFNAEFLEKLSWTEIKFIVCHEILHIMMLHGYRRGQDINDKLNRDLENIAMDLEVNHNLLTGFGFDRNDLSFLDSSKMGICLVDRIFKDTKDKINTDDIFEYYWNKLSKDLPAQEVAVALAGGQGTIDSHENLPELNSDELKELLEEATGSEDKAKQVMDEISRKAGKGSAADIFDAIYRPVKKKRKWESVVGNIRKGILRTGSNTDYQWIRPGRRTALLDKSIMLPERNTAESKEPKWDLWLFQDVSGSCSSYCQQFLDAARSIPNDTFKIRFHTFNSKVEPVDLVSGKYRTGGGTAFHIIEDYIQQEMNGSKRYPRLVWIITDGFGTEVRPEKPENWSWFLTPHNDTRLIPTESKIHELTDFSNFEQAGDF